MGCAIDKGVAAGDDYVGVVNTPLDAYSARRLGSLRKRQRGHSKVSLRLNRALTRLIAFFAQRQVFDLS